MIVERTTERQLQPATELVSDPAEVAISIRDVGKMYRIYDQPQDRLKQMLWRGRRTYGRDFWALRGVSFEVRRGESVGIIGRNGSGKSTLLQIIAGTLAPTQGQVRVDGSVAALLELGSGFNPEFTGRENVFLNGAILGVERAEMERRFDQIAAFADIGSFIDQPVKIYSSGMMVRLAFAVQAFLEPDVLIVDEALSVGDVYFQHKCMRRIKELVDRGTTLLFVSHSTATVKRFCQRGVWLDSGQVRYVGEAGVAVEKYLGFMRMLEAKDGVVALDEFDEDEEDVDLVASAAGIRASRRRALLASVADVLPLVQHRVDMADPRLFVQGDWQPLAIEGAGLAARQTNDARALAGFRCQGSQVELQLLQGPDCGDVRVEIDGIPRTFELFHQTERRVETVRLALAPGEHSVLIGLDKRGGERTRSLGWLGGQVLAPAPLAFKRDRHFGRAASAVERYGSGKGRLTAVELLDHASEQPVSEVQFGQRLRLRLHAERLQPAGPRLEFSFIVRDRNRIDLFGTTTVDEHVRLDPTATEFVVEFAFDVRLGPGSYSILAAFVECTEDLGQRVPMDQVDIAKVFTVAFDPSRPVWYVYHEPVVVRAQAGNEQHE
jgi:ABC-type polysaccharide/polyol phosphate transport system ATPase subunit